MVDLADFFLAKGTLERLFMLFLRSRNTVATSVLNVAFRNYKPTKIVSDIVKFHFESCILFHEIHPNKVSNIGVQKLQFQNPSL